MKGPNDPPFGPAAGAFLACGIGAVILGILTVAASVSTSAASALAFMPKVGPLSGEAIVASASFFIAWKGLGLLWRRSDPSPKAIFAATAAMVALGLLLTFPPVYRLF